MLAIIIIIIIIYLKGCDLYINPFFQGLESVEGSTLREIPHTENLLAKVNEDAEETSQHRTERIKLNIKLSSPHKLASCQGTWTSHKGRNAVRRGHR